MGHLICCTLLAIYGLDAQDTASLMLSYPLHTLSIRLPFVPVSTSRLLPGKFQEESEPESPHPAMQRHRLASPRQASSATHRSGWTSARSDSDGELTTTRPPAPPPPPDHLFVSDGSVRDANWLTRLQIPLSFARPCYRCKGASLTVCQEGSFQASLDLTRAVSGYPRCLVSCPRRLAHLPTGAAGGESCQRESSLP